MTKLYIAEPVKEPNADLAPAPTGGRLYSVDAEVEALSMKPKLHEDTPKYVIPNKGPYLMDGGNSFDFELNIFDTEKQLPIRGVLVEAGLVRGFTDRVGRIVLNLKRGKSSVIIRGEGYVETGSFAPVPRCHCDFFQVRWCGIE